MVRHVLSTTDVLKYLTRKEFSKDGRSHLGEKKNKYKYAYNNCAGVHVEETPLTAQTS